MWVPLHIIQLDPEDWRRYRALRLDALRQEPEAFASNLDENIARPDSYWRRRLEEASVGQYDWLLFAQHDNALVGMVGALDKGVPQTVEIGAMYVMPAQRGRGIGERLLHAILDLIARSRLDVVQAELTVRTSQVAALSVYRRMGFEPVKNVENQASQEHDGKQTLRRIMARA